MHAPNSLNIVQRKTLSGFLTYLAAAWFTGGVITPLLTKPEAFLQIVKVPIEGTIMAGVFLWFSLALLNNLKS